MSSLIIKEEDFPSLPSLHHHHNVARHATNIEEDINNDADTLANTSPVTTPVSTSSQEDLAGVEEEEVEYTTQDVLKMTKDKKQQLGLVNKKLESLYKELSNVFADKGAKDSDAKKLHDVQKRVDEIKASVNETRKKIEELESKKNNAREEKESLKEKIEVAKNKYSLGVQLKERKAQEVKDKDKMIKKMKKRTAKNKPEFMKPEEYDKEIEKQQKNLANANAEDKIKIEERIKHLQTEKPQCKIYYNNWERQVNENQKLKALKQELLTIENELKENNENKRKYTQMLADMKEDEATNAQLLILNKEYADKRKKLREARDELKKLLDAFKGQNQALYKKRVEIKEMIKQQKRTKHMLTDEADQWSSLLVTHKVEFKPSQIRILLGNKAQKIKTIIEQTSADVSVAKDANIVVIRGTEERADAALKAIQQLLEKNDREEATVRFKPDMVGVLLSKENLANLKKESNAKLFVDKLGGFIRIETDSSNMSNAKKVITKFLEDNAQAELSVPVDSEIASILVNATKRIRESSNVGRVYVNLEKRVVEISGRKGAVQKAKEMTEQLITQMKENKEVIKISKDASGRIIGKGGSNIRQMEKRTGAIITVDSAKLLVTIRGSNEAVAKAKEEVTKASQPKEQPKENKVSTTPAPEVPVQVEASDM